MKDRADHKTAYLDHAAGAPISNDVKDEVSRILEWEILPNPEAGYSLAGKWRRELADHKNQIARTLGVKAPSIFISNGATEASLKLFEMISPKINKERLSICILDIEHSSLLDQVVGSDKITGSVKVIKVSDLGLGGNGEYDLSKVLKSVDDQTVLISMQLINNETGQILPIKKLAGEIAKIRKGREERGVNTPLFLHSDASQGGTTMDLHIPRLGVDALTINGAKIGGLPSSGLLYISPELARWSDRVPTIGKEDPIKTATLNIALSKVQKKRPSEKKRLGALSESFWRELKQLVPGAELNLSAKMGKVKHSDHILSIHLPGINAERLVILAGQHGVFIGTGAACSANQGKPSHVLRAIGCSSTEIASSIRISFGLSNIDKAEVLFAAQKIAELCGEESVKL